MKHFEKITTKIYLNILQNALKRYKCFKIKKQLYGFKVSHFEI